MKRMPTSDAMRFGIDNEVIEMNGEWQNAPSRNNSKRFNGNSDKEYRQQQAGRTFVNSKQAETNQTRQQQSPVLTSLTQQPDSLNERQIRITDHALDYAADYHYTPFKLVCQPKLQDKKKAAKMINELISFIKARFSFSTEILFDSWWIDLSGDVQILIKNTELYVCLCNNERYPEHLNGTEISPVLPLHLPPQYTAIVKWIHNDVQDDDIREE
ncbi:unnamed protein product [Didymodactylos carnosus]|uniref:Uncharacterized protein n=1 Tax=Didymodactylos carnosus TaxID=1234261 RepID=A0A814PAB7_9BILA|nr:unnamed protein product [Didymodactylos carnosus]CAF1459426.1 unnamed protein product [Didymodactylos carnosus]CAF3866890.1 unnamed protein product [Didymodactylos carnosus]CAF4253058.1 unnamed protein product [Didymodactylos carnosus]